MLRGRTYDKDNLECSVSILTQWIDSNYWDIPKSRRAANIKNVIFFILFYIYKPFKELNK